MIKPTSGLLPLKKKTTLLILLSTWDALFLHLIWFLFNKWCFHIPWSAPGLATAPQMFNMFLFILKCFYQWHSIQLQIDRLFDFNVERCDLHGKETTQFYISIHLICYKWNQKYEICFLSQTPNKHNHQNNQFNCITPTVLQYKTSSFTFCTNSILP